MAGSEFAFTTVVGGMQSTVDFHKNREARRAARQAGRVWSNPHDLGSAANWQARGTFGCRGIWGQDCECQCCAGNACV